MMNGRPSCTPSSLRTALYGIVWLHSQCTVLYGIVWHCFNFEDGAERRGEERGMERTGKGNRDSRQSNVIWTHRAQGTLLRTPRRGCSIFTNLCRRLPLATSTTRKICAAIHMLRPCYACTLLKAWQTCSLQQQLLSMSQPAIWRGNCSVAFLSQQPALTGSSSSSWQRGFASSAIFDGRHQKNGRNAIHAVNCF